MVSDGPVDVPVPTRALGAQGVREIANDQRLRLCSGYVEGFFVARQKGLLRYGWAGSLLGNASQAGGPCRA